MDQDRARATIETQIATAHRAIHRAVVAAEQCGQEGLELDLRLLLSELSNIGERALSRRPKPQLKGQLRL